MKKFIVLAVLLFAVPAMAAVTINIVDDPAACEGRVEYTCSTAVVPRAFALTLTAASGNIVAPTPVAASTSADYYIFPGSIDVNAITGLVDGYGTPVAGALGGSSIIIEMGSLYEMAVEAKPATSGVLLKFTVDADTTVAVTEDTARGGIVMEDGSASGFSQGTNGPVTCGCPTCIGDLSGDSWKKLQDYFMLKGKLNAHKSSAGTYDMPDTNPAYDPCGDMNGDNWLKLQDYFMLKGELNAHKATAGTYDKACP